MSDEHKDPLELLIPLLRSTLPVLDDEEERAREHLWSLWHTCVTSSQGMAELVSLVALQALLSNKGIKLEAAVLPLFLEIVPLLNNLVYMRIYLHVLQRLIFLDRSSSHRKQVVLHCLKLATSTTTMAVKRNLITLVHQIFLETPQLIIPCSLSLTQPKLVPWLIEYAPSTRKHPSNGFVSN